MIKSFRRIASIVLLVSLLGSNILSLTNAAFHDFLYRALSALPISSLLANSPNSKRKALVKNNVQLKKNIKTIKASSRANNTKVKSISKRITTRTLRRAARNAAQVPVESIPYLGIGIIVAGTALDIKESCDSISDMNEILATLGVEPDKDSAGGESFSICEAKGS